MSPKNLPILKPFPAQPWSTPAASEPAKNWRRKHQELIDTIISTMKRDRSTEDLFEKKTSSTAAFGLSEEILYLSEADPADRELLIDWIGMAAATPIQKEGCAPVFGQGLASVLGARLMKAWAMATWDYIERPEWAKPLFHHIKLTQRHLPGLESDVAMMDMLTFIKAYNRTADPVKTAQIHEITNDWNGNTLYSCCAVQLLAWVEPDRVSSDFIKNMSQFLRNYVGNDRFLDIQAKVTAGWDQRILADFVGSIPSEEGQSSGPSPEETASKNGRRRTL